MSTAPEDRLDASTLLRERIESPGPVAPGRIGAFFDVDETLVRGASAFWAAKEMFRRSFFGTREVVYAAQQTARYVLFGENTGRIGDFSSRAAQVVAGNSVADMQALGEEIFEKYFIPRVYRATYDQLKAHVDAGHQVYLISATPWLIAEEFARRVGAIGGIGTKTKVHDGILVGELDGQIVHGEAKVAAVREAAREGDLLLEESWAYSDSSNDIPMLSTVGNPVAVNPDRTLKAYARSHNWPILRAYETRDLVKRYAGRAAVALGAVGLGYVAYRSGAAGARRTLRRDRKADSA